MQSKLCASGCPERNRGRGSWKLKHSDKVKSHQIENQITARIIKLPYQNFIESSCQSEGTIYRAPDDDDSDDASDYGCGKCSKQFGGSKLLIEFLFSKIQLMGQANCPA